MASAFSGYTCIVVVITLWMWFMASNGADAAANISTSTALLVTVDKAGKGDYSKIQDAIDAVPSNNKELVFILVKPSVYEEKIVVPEDKPYITISGWSAENTIITWNDCGNIYDSPTFAVLASDFVGRYLTFQNTFGAGARAVALRVSGDRAAFFGCRILSYQDTLLDDYGRHYYRNCYIEGAVDFICGNAASLFERCHLHSLSDGTLAITAQRRESPSEDTGFTFLGCKITGVRTALLGRPWGAYSRVIFAFSFMSDVILPQGWEDWEESSQSSKKSTVFYREYKCYGAGSNRKKRVQWSHKLSDQDAEIFLTKNMIGGGRWIRSKPPTHFKKASFVVSNNTITHS